MLINEANPHGGDIYRNKVVCDFSANINPFGMPEAVRQAIVEAAGVCSVYPDPYCAALREMISSAEGVPAGDVICGCGAAELIYQFAYSLEKGRPALVVCPTFCEYETALAAAGIEAERYYLSEADGFRPTDKILDLDFGKYSAVFLCSPNNPTGVTADPGIVRAIAGSGVRMLCDFCFIDLTDHPGKYDVPSLTGEYPNVTVLKAFTKSYAMAGVRLGYAICGDPGFMRAMSGKTQCWNVSVIAQRAGIAALGCGGWLDECVRYISAERERLIGALTSLGVKTFRGEANYLLIRSVTDLAEKLMEKGIMIRDCSNYAGLEKGYFRIAVRTREENDMLIAGIKEALK